MKSSDDKDNCKFRFNSFYKLFIIVFFIVMGYNLSVLGISLYKIHNLIEIGKDL